MLLLLQVIDVLRKVREGTGDEANQLYIAYKLVLDNRAIAAHGHSMGPEEEEVQKTSAFFWTTSPPSASLYSTYCPCLLDADRCLRSDGMTNPRLQVSSNLFLAVTGERDAKKNPAIRSPTVRRANPVASREAYAPFTWSLAIASLAGSLILSPAKPIP